MSTIKELKCKGCGDVYTINWNESYDEEYCELCRKELDSLPT